MDPTQGERTAAVSPQRVFADRLSAASPWGAATRERGIRQPLGEGHFGVRLPSLGAGCVCVGVRHTIPQGDAH